MDRRILSAMDATIQWIMRSFQATGYKGSAHSYSYWLNAGDGWAKAYPETTGYLLETLLAYSKNTSLPANDLIRQQAYWLLSTQLDSGAFPSGKYYSKGPKKPSIFNTGQILFGLYTGYELTAEPVFFNQMERAVQWLLDQRNPDGSWSAFAWKEDYSPAYYSRVIWPILKVASISKKKAQLYTSLEPTMEHYLAYQKENGTFMNWGFQKGYPAFTHTIAYTLRGWLETYLILKQERFLQAVIRTSDALLLILEKNKRLAGSYNEDWQGDDRFICVTGHIQLAIVLFKLHKITGEGRYKKASTLLFHTLLPYILLKRHRGGIPGSIPFYGKYNPLRYPNWAAKFFVDYCLMIIK